MGRETGRETERERERERERESACVRVCVRTSGPSPGVEEFWVIVDTWLPKIPSLENLHHSVGDDCKTCHVGPSSARVVNEVDRTETQETSNRMHFKLTCLRSPPHQSRSFQCDQETSCTYYWSPGLPPRKPRHMRFLFFAKDTRTRMHACELNEEDIDN